MFFKKQLTEKEQEQIIELRMQIRELEFSKKQHEKEANEDKKEFEIEYKRKLEELQHKFKLEKETRDNEIANMKANIVLKHEQDIAKIKSDYDKKLIEEKERLNKEFYDKMTTSLAELHSKGNHTTDFLKEMTLKMLDKAPVQAQQVGYYGEATRNS